MITSLKSLLAISFLAINSFVSYAQPVSDSNDFLILGIDRNLPKDVTFIDDIWENDGYAEIDCSYNQALEAAERKARKKGGNVIKIKRVLFPDNWNSCYRIKGDIYRMDDVRGYWKEQARLLDSVCYNDVTRKAGYAVLMLYINKIERKPRADLVINDSVACRLTSFSRYGIRLTKMGKTKIWASCAPQAVIEIDVQPGKTYFIKCMESLAAYNAPPTLTLMDTWNGFHGYYNLPRGEEFQANVKENAPRERH